MVYTDGGGIRSGGAEGLARTLGLEPLRMKRFGQLFPFGLFLLFPSDLVSAFSASSFILFFL